jgi:peroxiredoxin
MNRPARLSLLLLALPCSAFAEQSGESAVAAPVATTAAAELPAMKLRGLDGATHSLDEWQGKLVLLNFWAAWCAPCQAEIPDLVAYQRRYAKRGLQVIGVGIDAEQPLRNVQRSLDMNYPILIAAPDGQRGLLQRWGDGSGIIPYTVVIDRRGHIVYTRRGPMDRDEMDSSILPLLD